MAISETKTFTKLATYSAWKLWGYKPPLYSLGYAPAVHLTVAIHCHIISFQDCDTASGSSIRTAKMIMIPPQSVMYHTGADTCRSPVYWAMESYILAIYTGVHDWADSSLQVMLRPVYI